MKNTFGGVLGLALLAASFTCSGSLVYAQTPEETSSTAQALVLDVAASGSESMAIWDCDSEDGIGACPVDAQLVGNDELPTATITSAAAEATATEVSATEVSAAEVSAAEASATETSATEVSSAETVAETAIQAVDAIIVEVTQTVTIAVPGEGAAVIEEPAQTGSISEPSTTEPVLVADEKTAPEAAAAPSIEAADAIAVEVTQSVSVAAAGQAVETAEAPASTGSIAESATAEPASMPDATPGDPAN
jgi:hypothetical protein